MSSEEDGKLMYSRTSRISVPIPYLFLSVLANKLNNYETHCDNILSLGSNWKECECTFTGTMFCVVKFSEPLCRLKL